jgi:hypothetical protein
MVLGDSLGRMKQIAMLFASLAATAAVISGSARRRVALRERCIAWLSTQPDPAPTSTVVFTDQPSASWVDYSVEDIEWRGNDALTMDLVLDNTIALAPCSRVVVGAGERDLRDGVPIADVIGDLARLHDHLVSTNTPLEVIAARRPFGRWGGAIDTLNGEFERLCDQRKIPLLWLDDNSEFAALLGTTS